MQIKTLPNVTRQALVQSRQMDPQTISSLFDAKKGDVVTGPVGQGPQVIVARRRQHPAGGRRGCRAADRCWPPSSSTTRSLQDMLSAARAHAVAVVKPEGDLAAAHQALGVAQDETAQSGARPKRGPAL